MIGIYQIHNIINDKRYIGQSVVVKYRLNNHKATLIKGNHRNTYLQKAFNKYGIDSFEFKPLIECSRDNLDFYEDLLITGYNSNKSDSGYNLRLVNSSNAGMLTKRNTHKPGDKYNRLTLIEPTFMPGDRGSWYAKCDCGNTHKVYPKELINGHTKSCGCWNLEVARNRWPKHQPGEAYNRWTLIERQPNTAAGRPVWLCQCDCGNQKILLQRYILNGESKSCGCYKSEVTTQRNLDKVTRSNI